MRTSEEANENSADLRSKSYNMDSVSGSQQLLMTLGAYLILTTFPSVRALHVHHHDIHALATAHPYSCMLVGLPQIVTEEQPRTFGSLLAPCLIHDIEIGTEQPVQQRTCTGR